jgi:hypothetical protein
MTSLTLISLRYESGLGLGMQVGHGHQSLNPNHKTDMAQNAFRRKCTEFYILCLWGVFVE